MPAAIGERTQGQPSDALATVTWSHRIDDDDLATGDNLIRLTVKDRRGRTATSEVTIAKRLF